MWRQLIVACGLGAWFGGVLGLVIDFIFIPDPEWLDQVVAVVLIELGAGVGGFVAALRHHRH